MFRAVVPGRPIPKARARVYATRAGSVRATTPARTRNVEYTVGWHLKLAWRQEPDALSRFGISCLFVFPLTVTGNERRVDGDNCLKLVLDAGNGVVWQDDSQVREQHVQVAFGDNPRSEITFWTLRS